MNIIDEIIDRMLYLGYPQEVYFPEVNKILNIISNSKDRKLIKKYIEDCSRRAYELGIMDEQLDKLLDKLYMEQ